MEFKYVIGEVEIKLLFITKRKYHNYKGVGKSYPKHTQCLFFINGLLEGFGEVIKHEKDPDNKKVAMLKATKKALSDVYFVDRKNLWNKIIKDINNIN